MGAGYGAGYGGGVWVPPISGVCEKIGAIPHPHSKPKIRTLHFDSRFQTHFYNFTFRKLQPDQKSKLYKMSTTTFSLDIHTPLLYITRMLNEEFFIDDLESPSETPPPAPIKVKEWPSHFVMELALGLETPDALCVRYDITLEEYALMQLNPTFQLDLKNWRTRMADEGLSFKLKARVQAESYLEEIDDIVTDSNTSKETKLAAISRVVSWAGLDIKTAAETQRAGGPAVTINITRFSDDQAKPNTIEIN